MQIAHGLFIIFLPQAKIILLVKMLAFFDGIMVKYCVRLFMDIRELMTDDLGKVKEFAAYCDEMINSRYILAEGKIIKILQTVATSTVLQRVIGDALKGFDYSAAAADWSAGKIKPPFAEKHHVALLFCILADVDSRKIYLSDFLRKFF